jgi:hypothetical protein
MKSVWIKFLKLIFFPFKYVGKNWAREQLRHDLNEYRRIEQIDGRVDRIRWWDCYK